MIRFLFLFVLFIFNSCTWNELPKVICEPDEQLFELVQPIIQDNCMSCHSNSDLTPVVLGSYDGVIDALRNYSLKEEVINRTMPPYGSDPLSESDISIIQKWADCE